MRRVSVTILLSGCFVLSREDLRHHDVEVIAGAKPVVDSTATPVEDTSPAEDTAEPETFALVLAGEAFGALDGYYVEALVFDTTGAEVASERTRIGGNTFEIAFRDEILVGEPHVVDVLVELNRDGICSYDYYYGLENPYRLEEPRSGERDLRLVVNASTDFDAETCASFP